MATFFTPKAKRSKNTSASKAVDISIDAHDHAGNGLCLSTAPITVVANALIGERCRVSYTKQSKKVNFALVTKVISASVLRTAPFCDYYTQCGGCSLQHTNAAHGLALKQTALQDFIANKLNIPALTSGIPQWEAPVLSDIDYSNSALNTAYRRRVRLAIDARNKQKIKIGFRAQGSDTVVDIPKCAIASSAINECLPGLRQALIKLPSVQKVGHIVITQGEYAVQVAIYSRDGLCKKSLAALGELPTALNIELVIKQKNQDEICLYPSSAQLKTQNLSSSLLSGSLVIEDIPDVKLHIKSGHFLQVNKAVNQGMVRMAKLWLAPDITNTLYDFHCGAGNFALSMAKDVKRVNGFEGVNAMVEVARLNAGNMGIANAEFFTTDLASSQALKSVRFTNDAMVILDPSREGALALCQFLATSHVKKIVYVSCNPNSFVRDAEYLLPAYKMSKIAALDMFPFTKHIELIALFTRRE